MCAILTLYLTDKEFKKKSKQNLPADVSLFEVWSHAYCLPVELISLLQSRIIGPDQIC